MVSLTCPLILHCTVLLTIYNQLELSSKLSSDISFSNRAMILKQQDHFYEFHGGPPPQCVELKKGGSFVCTPMDALKSTINQSFDISNTRFLLGCAQKHICNIIEELFLKAVSSIMFQICYPANHTQDQLFKISNIIQNLDWKYISRHILLCTQNCHLNANSTLYGR